MVCRLVLVAIIVDFQDHLGEWLETHIRYSRYYVYFQIGDAWLGKSLSNILGWTERTFRFQWSQQLLIDFYRAAVF